MCTLIAENAPSFRDISVNLFRDGVLIDVLYFVLCCVFTQQAEALKRHTDLKVGMYWGSMGVDFWDAPTWKQEVDTYEVLFPYF